MFPQRSKAEKDRIVSDLYGTLSSEDLKYLRSIHIYYAENTPNAESMPFGSEEANRAHLLGEEYRTNDTKVDFNKRFGSSRCNVVKSKHSIVDTYNLYDRIRLVCQRYASDRANNQMIRIKIGNRRMIFRPLTFFLFSVASRKKFSKRTSKNPT